MRQEFAQRALALAGRLIGKGRSRAYKRNRERLTHGIEEGQRLLEEGIAVAGLKGKELVKFIAKMQAYAH